MSRTPTFEEVMREAVTAGFDGLHTAIPARVERYDAAVQAVDAQPLVKLAYEDETGTRVAAQFPVVPNCPVVFPTGGGLSIVFPIAVGDTGLLVFSEASLDKWKQRGDLVDPDVDHRFHVSDAIFIPGVVSFKTPRKTTPATFVQIGRDGATGKRAARETDTINVSLSDLQACLDLRYMQNPGPPVPLTRAVGGSITSGSDDVKLT